MTDTRNQVSKTVTCTMCGRTIDSYRIHKLTCSVKCRKQRSRLMTKIAADAAAAEKAKKMKAKRKKPASKQASKKKVKKNGHTARKTRTAKESLGGVAH